MLLGPLHRMVDAAAKLERRLINWPALVLGEELRPHTEGYIKTTDLVERARPRRVATKIKRQRVEGKRQTACMYKLPAPSAGALSTRPSAQTDGAQHRMAYTSAQRQQDSRSPLAPAASFGGGVTE